MHVVSFSTPNLDLVTTQASESYNWKSEHTSSRLFLLDTVHSLLVEICLERWCPHHDFWAPSFNTFYLSLCLLDAAFAYPWGGGGISCLVTDSNPILLHRLDFDVCPLLMSSGLGSVSIVSAFHLPQHWLLMTLCTESKTPSLVLLLCYSPLPCYHFSLPNFKKCLSRLDKSSPSHHPLPCGFQPKNSRRSFEKPVKWRHLSRNPIK